MKGHFFRLLEVWDVAALGNDPQVGLLDGIHKLELVLFWQDLIIVPPEHQGGLVDAGDLLADLVAAALDEGQVPADPVVLEAVKPTDLQGVLWLKREREREKGKSGCQSLCGIQWAEGEGRRANSPVANFSF